MFGFIHLAALLVTVPFILYADHVGFQYIRGKKKTVSRRQVEIPHIVIFIGLGLLIASGIGLALPEWDYYIKEPAFLLKIFFVMVLVFNGLFIGKFMKVASITPFAILSRGEKLVIFISGALSTAGWIASAVIGFFFL